MPARDDRGVAFPSPLVILSIVAVAMAAIAFVATSGGGGGGGSEMEPVAKPSEAVSTTPTVAPEPVKVKKKPKKIDRAKVYVVVFNSSGISGLAGRTAGEAQAAGWQVVGSDNWHGLIPASTVYYPDRLKAAAKLLAKDLGINRVMPAVEPMNFDRLTVILTADHAG